MSGHHDALACRRAGVLAHITSLPGPGGCGDLGPDAYRFVDWLVEAGQTVWQTLPLSPTHGDGSPYSSLSVHAGNPALISAEWLIREDWVDSATIGAQGGGNRKDKAWMLAAAHERFRREAARDRHREFHEFCARHAHWLDDFALYCALRERYDDANWSDWPAAVRDREPQVLKEARQELAVAIERISFEQFVFFKQWSALRRYANDRGVLMFGDMPIFVAHDSADVWGRRDIFALDGHARPAVVAGVPPDYFSETGQRWGNPLYCWDRMAADRFDWWRVRLRGQLELFDLVRIDHFRGFEAYWEIPAHEETAINGRWVKAPGDDLFAALKEEFNPLPIVAEDLGLITEEVRALRSKYHIPGMKVLQFAFEGGPDNPYLPHNYEPNSVVYTGTHDNNTTLGWYRDLRPPLQHHVVDYLAAPPGEQMPWPLLRCAFASVARLAVVPMQDVLALGGEHRMNTPGIADGNWSWRFEWGQVPADAGQRLRHLAELYGRLPRD